MDGRGSNYTAPNTVTILSFLYSTIVALALTTALRNILSPSGQFNRGPFEIPINDFLLFCTFVVVVIPFYHGAVWALVKTFNRATAETRGGLMIITFAAMLLEASLFYAMASSINLLYNFILWFGALMLLDSVWVAIAHCAGATDKEAPWEWAFINIGMIIFLVVFWNFIDVSLPRYVLLLTAVVVRTIMDYYLTRKYYFPELG